MLPAARHSMLHSNAASCAGRCCSDCHCHWRSAHAVEWTHNLAQHRPACTITCAQQLQRPVNKVACAQHTPAAGDVHMHVRGKAFRLKGFLCAQCRCLCIPKVLYGTITQASKLGLGVLTLLTSCQANATSNTPFLTQWAVRDNTTCPNIPIDARMGDLLADFGDAVIVPSSMSRAQWAWGNMLNLVKPWESLPTCALLARSSLAAKACN